MASHESESYSILLPGHLGRIDQPFLGTDKELAAVPGYARSRVGSLEARCGWDIPRDIERRVCPVDWTWAMPSPAWSATLTCHRYCQDFDQVPNF
jgi:hypothetical protein